MSTFTYNPNGHRYELDGKLMTGVTTVLGVIAKPALIGWAAKQTAEWIRENCLWNEDKDAPEDRHCTVTESDLQEAVKAHTKKKEEGGKGGKDLHSEVEAWIKFLIEKLDGDPYKLSDEHEDEIDKILPNPSRGIQEFARWSQLHHIKFISSETPTYSKEWFVAGTPDFTFEKDGKRFVGDLKSYKKIWDRVPHLQCAAYAKMLSEQGQGEFAGTCIVNINKETGELTESWSYDLARDTAGFVAALTLYRQLQ